MELCLTLWRRRASTEAERGLQSVTTGFYRSRDISLIFWQSFPVFDQRLCAKFSWSITKIYLFSISMKKITNLHGKKSREKFILFQHYQKLENNIRIPHLNFRRTRKRACMSIYNHVTWENEVLAVILHHKICKYWYWNFACWSNN